MSIKFRFKRSVDAVFEALTDPDFLVKRNMALGDIETDCEVDRGDGQLLVKQLRTVPLDVSPFLQMIFGVAQTVQVEEVWNQTASGWLGQIKVEFDGQPLRINAKFSLEKAPGGALYEVSHQVSAKIPLVGRRIERETLEKVNENVVRELEMARLWLSGRPLQA